MGTWLDVWSNLSLLQRHREEFLTNDTFLIAPYFKSIEECCEILYLLENLNFDFVLYGKFQNDHSESRFGLYRQICGGNRLVSAQEIKGERKLKINSLLRLHSPSFTISVKKYLLEFSDSVKSTTLSKGDQNFFEEFPYNEVAFDETQLPVCSMLQGMVPKKSLQDCLVVVANNCLLMKAVNFCRLT